MSKEKLPKSKDKLPKYEAYLSLNDMIDIENYEQQGKRITYRKDGNIEYNQEHSDLDIAVYVLKLGLKEIEGKKVEDNVMDVLESYGADDIIRISAEIRLDAIKKKPKTS